MEAARVASVLAFGRDAVGWQRFKHRPRGAQIGGLEAFRKSVVHRCKDSSRLCVPALPNSQACETCGAPQFPHQRALPPSHLDCPAEILVSNHGGPIARILEQQLAFLAHQFGHVPAFFVALASGQRLFDRQQALGNLSSAALSSRTLPALRLGRLRADHQLLELGAGDLAMSVPEAAMLLEAAGLPFEADQLERLVERAEGWPDRLSGSLCHSARPRNRR